MKKNKMLLCGIIVTLSTFIGLHISTPTLANEEKPYVLSVKDWGIDLGTLNPGDVVEGEYIIKNAGTEDFTYEAVAKPYAMLEDGATTSYSVDNLYSQMKEWIVFRNPTGTVPADSEYTIYFTVKVPENAPAGSQYVGLHTTAFPINDDDAKTSKIQSLVAVAPLLRANINGDTHINGVVLENNLPSFFLEPKISASAMVQNNGNVGFDVEYFLQVFPLFSDEELYTNEEKPLTNLVMPDSKRYISQEWEDAPAIGIFKVKQTVIAYNDKSINEKIVIVCPLWLICLVIFGIIAAVFWVIAKAKMRKTSKKE